MRPRKPYRLYFRKDTGYYSYKLPGLGWRTTGKTKEHEAHAYVLERLAGAGGKETAGNPLAAEIPLKDYALPAFERYVADKKAAAGSKPSLSDDYIAATRRYLKRFLTDDPMAALPLGKISSDDFQAFQTRLLVEKLPDKRMTAIRALEAVRLILRRAEKLGHISRSPDRAVDAAQGNPRQRGTYTDAELEKMFPADVWEKKDFSPWAGPLDYTASILAAASGMRRAEVLALTWEAVHLDEGKEYLEIRGSAKPRGKTGPTKGKRPRATPLFDFVLWPNRRAVKALKELRKRATAQAVILRMDGMPEGPVFAQAGERVGTTWWAKHFRAALNKAEIPRDRGEGKLPADAHTLRHTLASRLKAAGLPDDLIRRFCGWASLNIQDRYTHLGPDVFNKLMELVRVTSEV
jgi:integrase